MTETDKSSAIIAFLVFGVVLGITIGYMKWSAEPTGTWSQDTPTYEEVSGRN